MERGVIVGGLLVSMSLLLAAVFNTHASRDRASSATPDTPLPVVAPDYDKTQGFSTVIPTQEAVLPLSLPSDNVSLLPKEQRTPAPD